MQEKNELMRKFFRRENCEKHRTEVLYAARIFAFERIFAGLSCLCRDGLLPALTKEGRPSVNSRVSQLPRPGSVRSRKHFAKGRTVGAPVLHSARLFAFIPNLSESSA